MSDQSGRVLSRRYRLSRMISSGDLGTLYEGMDLKSNRKVAVEQFQHDLISASSLRRVHAEAQRLAKLQHPHIIQILDWNSEPDGSFMIMEYAGQGSLAQWLNREQFADGLPIEDVLHISSALASALVTVHANRILHRSLKPTNVLLVESDPNTLVPKLANFSIGHSSSFRVGDTSSLIQPSTLPHMAPEQLRGQQPSKASDVYSMGVLLYQLLTNRHYLELSEQPDENMRRICEEEPPAPKSLRDDLPEWLNDLTLELLRKEPDKRPTAGELYRRLQGQKGPAPLLGKHRRPSAGALRQGMPRRWDWAIALVCILLGCVLLIAFEPGQQLLTFLVETISPNLEGSTVVIVSEDGPVNLRATPSIGAPILQALEPGTPVTLLARDDSRSWYLVRTANEQLGWVSTAYTPVIRGVWPRLPTHEEGQPLERRDDSLAIQAVVGDTSPENGLRLRSQANSASSVVSVLPPGTVVEIIRYNTDRSWAYVDTFSLAGAGWVSSAYLVVNEHQP